MRAVRLCALLVLASQRHARLHALGIDVGRVPPLRVGATEDHEQQIAQEIEEGGHEEHQAPLVHSALFLEEGRVESQVWYELEKR